MTPIIYHIIKNELQDIYSNIHITVRIMLTILVFEDLYEARPTVSFSLLQDFSKANSQKKFHHIGYNINTFNMSPGFAFSFTEIWLYIDLGIR